jgi:hypothetical protein
MVILRCSWHPRNYGRTKLLGVSNWRGLELTFKAALCLKCAERIHPDVRAKFGFEVPRRGCAAEILALLLLLSTGIVVTALSTGDVRLTDARPLRVTPDVPLRAVPAGDAARSIALRPATSAANVHRQRVRDSSPRSGVARATAPTLKQANDRREAP